MNVDKAIFIEAVQADDTLPAAFRERASEVEGLELQTIDQSYLDFLREQIALEPRGPEWTALLAKRFTALAPYRDIPLLFGIINTPTGYAFVRVNPDTKRIIYHEEEYGSAGSV